MGRTNGRRNKRQKLREKFSKAREEAQLADVIETTAEGAVRKERVDPATQDEQKFPGLDRQAIREGDGQHGWTVPDHVKRKVVETSAEVLFEKKVIEDKDGNEITLPPDRKAQQEAAKTLILADQTQFKRDNPEIAGRAEGGPGGLINELAALMQAAQVQREAALPTPEAPKKLPPPPKTNGTTDGHA